MRKMIEVIVRGLVQRGNEVLLCQNLVGGYFYLPGGHIEFGESAAEALRRELQEELGVGVLVTDLALASEGSFTNGGETHHELNLVFHVKHEIGSHVTSKEPDVGFRWFDLASIVDVDLRPPSTKAWLMAGVGDRWISDMEPKAAR